MKTAGQPAELDVTVDIYGKPLTFHLQRRQMPLGNLLIDYHWMNGAEFRAGTKTSDRGLENLSRCITLWWRHVRYCGKQDDQQVLWNFLLAQCYPLVAKSHGPNKIYRGAFTDRIKRNYDIEYPFDLPLSDVTSDNVGKKLHSILRGEDLNKEAEEYAFGILSEILNWGIEKVRRDHWGGLEEFLGKFEVWWDNRRKRGKKHPYSVRMLDIAAFQCELAFLECYSNAWIAIIEKLERDGLDGPSPGFLRFVHFQNFQPMPDGGPPGPLGGLVLALHPLFTYLEQSPRLAEACGEFFQEVTAEDIDQANFGKLVSYQKFLGAVTLAAMQYRDDLDRQKEGRRPTYELTNEQEVSDDFGESEKD